MSLLNDQMICEGIDSIDLDVVVVWQEVLPIASRRIGSRRFDNLEVDRIVIGQNEELVAVWINVVFEFGSCEVQRP